MQPDDLKLPKKKPSIKDQIYLSRFGVGVPKKYIDVVRGVDINSQTLIGRTLVSQPQQLPVNQENDYLENTYIDDYFE